VIKLRLLQESAYKNMSVTFAAAVLIGGTILKK